MIALIWCVVEVKVFAEESYGMKEGKQYKVLQGAPFMHRMNARYFVGKICRPHAVLNGLAVNIGEHPQRNVYDSICF